MPSIPRGVGGTDCCPHFIDEENGGEWPSPGSPSRQRWNKAQDLVFASHCHPQQACRWGCRWLVRDTRSFLAKRTAQNDFSQTLESSRKGVLMSVICEKEAVGLTRPHNANPEASDLSPATCHPHPKAKVGAGGSLPLSALKLLWNSVCFLSLGLSYSS